VKKFIFVSSVAVYGTRSEPTDENTLPTPDTPYGRSKLAAEKVVAKWAQEDPTRQVIIIRPTVIFGPKNYANVYNLIDQIYHRRFIFVGDGSNIKSVAYVENLVEATRFLLCRMKSGVDIYNYVDEKQMTTKQIVEIVSRLLSVPIPKIKIPLWLTAGFGSIFDLLGKITGYNFPITGKRIKKFCTETYHNADKIRALSFQQPVSLDEGFKRTIAWYLESRQRSTMT
jgi:nucleoside-diphosphate-sugar epimerase